MAVRVPTVVSDVAAQRDLGAFDGRYPYRSFAPYYLPVTALVMIGAWAGANVLVGSLFTAVTVGLLAWDLGIRRNRAVYLYDDGYVHVNTLGAVKRAARWEDITAVTGRAVRVQTLPRSFTRGDYAILHGDGPELSFTTATLRDADDLVERIAQRRLDLMKRQLRAGERVTFGVFTVGPTDLTFTPSDHPFALRRAPATVPWSAVGGVHQRPVTTTVQLPGEQPKDVTFPTVIVDVAGPDGAIAALLAEVPDADLFAQLTAHCTTPR